MDAQVDRLKVKKETKFKQDVLAVVAMSLRAVYKTRLPLIKALTQQYKKVVVFAPVIESDSIPAKELKTYHLEIKKAFKDADVDFIELPGNGSRFNVLSKQKYRKVYRQEFKKRGIKHVLVFHYDAAVLLAQSIDTKELKTFALIMGAYGARLPKADGFLTKGIFQGFTNFINFCRTKLKDQGLKFLSKQLTHVIVQNSKDAEIYEQNSIFDPKIMTIVNGAGVDLERFTSQPLDRVSPLTFLFVGRLQFEKGFYDYCEAVQIVRKKYPGMRFHAIGGLKYTNGKPATFYTDLAQKSGVEYVGDVLDVRPHMINAHVVVFPSHGEATSKTLLEALAIGRPIITTNVSGCEQTVTPRENGAMVNVSDPWAIANAMTFFIESSDQLQKMAMASRKLAETKFDANLINADIIKALESSPNSKE